jgi:tRNA threonylcarbamoyladenosine biosynthesis protein TsaB
LKFKGGADLIILAFESTGKIASVALSENERVLAKYSIDNGNTQSELLLPMAESLLSSLSLSFSDVSGYAVAVGPGSFTGVRIGVATVKGLAFNRNLPIFAISSIEALAKNLEGVRGIIVPCMDARRAQVYYGIYRADENGISKLEDDGAISLEGLLEKLCIFSGEDIYIVGDGYEIVKGYLDGKIVTKDTPIELRFQNAASLCRIAYEKHKRGESVSDLDVLPKYLRLPQAERERLEKEKIK